ncbi:VOC family protein [Jiella sonneratiae]|uniref:Lactoylglutathione lyase n=1 Tax=Jiella sonneratiae TaxID=2816856 RepID=A0ABS3J957_9HYPH|nr:VOC family protein [Jiella sonneratiae]MBO0906204.1 lactoylglutathione lyase [Jiella sonneratiae]
MSQKIFINLPVTDVGRSTAFYEAMGATKNERFSNETASCMVLSEEIHVMLLEHARWRDFTPKTIPDARTSAQVLLCLTLASRAACDTAVDTAVAAGGSADPTPKQDFGFMYGRSYEDPDGHIWEVSWMDLDAMERAMAAGGAGSTG